MNPTLRLPAQPAIRAAALAVLTAVLANPAPGQVQPMLLTGPGQGLTDTDRNIFQSHNQKVVENANGIFCTFNGVKLDRSTDGGQTFTRVYDRGLSVDTYRAPTIETDENNNLYLIYPEPDLNRTRFEKFTSANGYTSPTLTTTHTQASSSSKFASFYDQPRQRLYHATQGGYLFTFNTSGGFVAGKQVWTSGSGAVPSFPHLFLDDAGTLHFALTTANSLGNYESIRYLKSTDGGVNWRKMDGTAVTTPVSCGANDANSTQINLEDEEASTNNLWLANMHVKNGKVHFMYRARGPTPARQHYMRFNASTGVREIDSHTDFPGGYMAGETIINSSSDDGSFASDPANPAGPLFAMFQYQGDKIAALVSHDNGSTWNDAAVSADVDKTYDVGSYRFSPKYGRVCGTFTSAIPSWATPQFYQFAVAPVTNYWDVNGSAAGFGFTPSGTWGTSGNWSTNSAGTSTTANRVTTIWDTLYFGTDELGFTNAGGVNNSGAVSVGAIHVGAGNLQDFTFHDTGTRIILGPSGKVTYNSAGKWLRIYPDLVGARTSLTFDGNGTKVVHGGLPNTAVTVSGGTLSVANNNTIKSLTVSTSTVSGGGTLTLNNSGGRGIYNSLGDNLVSNDIELASGSTVGGNSLDFGSASGTTLTLNGTISSAAGYGMDIWGSGGGTVVFGAANTFSGTLNISWGTVRLGIANAIADACPVIISSGQTLDLNGFSDTIASLSLNGNGAGGSGALRNNGAAAATLTCTGITLAANATIGGSADLALPNPVSGSGFGLTKTGANTLTLSGANTYTGATTVNQGTLIIGPGGSVNSASMLSIASGAVVNLSQSAWNAFGATQQSGTWTIAGTLRATTPQANTVVAHVSLNNGTLDSTGGAPTGYGAFYLAGKTITANGAANTISGNGRVGITGTVTLNTPLATDALDISAAVGATSAQSGGLTKTGAGTVTLSGSNTYTGATSVGQGVLLVNAPGSLSPNSNLTVAPAATLGGSGTAGAVSLGGILAPGNSAGTLTAGAVAFQPGSTYLWELANWTGSTPGTHWDRLAAASLAFNNTPADKLTIRILGPFANFSEASKTFTIATASGAVTGFNAAAIAIDATGFPGTGTWGVQQIGSTIELKYTVAADDYNAWAAAVPGFTDSDPAHDPDGDGLDNFTEYAFGLDPTKGTSASPATAPDRSTGTFTYTRRKPALTGLTCIYQSSTALGGWTAFTPVSATSNNGDPVETITVTIPAALLAEPKLFLRVTATEP